VLRIRGDPAIAAEPVRRALQRVVPAPSYVVVQPLATIVAGAQRSWRLGATMFTAFGALAAVIAAVGLYSVIAYDVAQRAHELSVRIALGARARDVTRLVMVRGIWFAIAGIASGMLVSLFGARWLQPMLFRQSATDPSIYAGVGVLLVVAAITACAAPAWRAARADPNLALRAD
jgi:ABC-type antimicrobial peptide transport system permease subunit